MGSGTWAAKWQIPAAMDKSPETMQRISAPFLEGREAERKLGQSFQPPCAKFQAQDPKSLPSRWTRGGRAKRSEGGANGEDRRGMFECLQIRIP